MCTIQKHDNIFILTITGDGDHRLNPALIDSIRSALGRVKSESESDPMRPTALITTAEGNFFSNGYDLSWALSDPDPARTRPKIMSKKLRLLVEDLISLPMPTIAAVNGHAAAAGFILALSHDYILMRGDRGYLYMSELDINYKLSNWFVKVLKSKIGCPKILRNVILKAEKIDAGAAVEWGIVDSAHESAAATVAAAAEMAADLVGRKLGGELYAANRRSVFADVLAALGSDEVVGDDVAHVVKVVSKL